MVESAQRRDRAAERKETFQTGEINVILSLKKFSRPPWKDLESKQEFGLHFDSEKNRKRGENIKKDPLGNCAKVHFARVEQRTKSDVEMSSNVSLDAPL